MNRLSGLFLFLAAAALLLVGCVATELRVTNRTGTVIHVYSSHTKKIATIAADATVTVPHSSGRIIVITGRDEVWEYHNVQSLVDDARRSYKRVSLHVEISSDGGIRLPSGQILSPTRTLRSNGQTGPQMAQTDILRFANHATVELVVPPPLPIPASPQPVPEVLTVPGAPPAAELPVAPESRAVFGVPALSELGIEYQRVDNITNGPINLSATRVTGKHQTNDLTELSGLLGKVSILRGKVDDMVFYRKGTNRVADAYSGKVRIHLGKHDGVWEILERSIVQH